MWSRETLVPGLYGSDWYNGKKIEKGWLANIEDYLVGVPRVRLLRVKQGKMFFVPQQFCTTALWWWWGGGGGRT